MTNSFKKSIASTYIKWPNLFLLVIIVLLFSSCSTTKTSAYFVKITRDTVLTSATLQQGEIKIQKGDVLALAVSSLNKEEDIIYNSTNAGSGYEVDNNGDIYLHHLGKINVTGLTRRQLKLKLEEGLKPYLKDPVIYVTFTNHHVTIVGSVGNPQVIQMPAEKISIFDVLAGSGGMVPSTSLSNIVVVRDSSDDKKEIRQLNLEDHSIFSSDFYYLRPNDIVVVKPDEKELLRQQKRLDFQQVSSIVLQTITITLIIYNTFFRN